MSESFELERCLLVALPAISLRLSSGVWWCTVERACGQLSSLGPRVGEEGRRLVGLSVEEPDLDSEEEDVRRLLLRNGGFVRRLPVL